MSTVVDVVVAVCALVGACVLAVVVVLVPMGLYGHRLERRPRTVNRGRMPAHYEQVRRELEAEQLAAAQVVAEAEDIIREAAP